MYFLTQIVLTIRCIMKAGAMLSMAPYTHVRIERAQIWSHGTSWIEADDLITFLRCWNFSDNILVGKKQ